MKLYRYWARAEQDVTIDDAGNIISLSLKKWRGSNLTPDDAMTQAKEAVAELAARLGRTADIRYAHEYTYSTNDLPEELISLIDDENGITRNRYGAEILNTNTLMIADIDLRTPSALGKFIASLFRLPSPEQKARKKLENWLRTNPQAGVRIYRTHSGLRYLFTDTPRQADDENLTTLKALDSDRLYIRLCKAQKCFRARLTPKPWRIDSEKPPATFPCEPTREQANYDKWLKDYTRKSKNFASTCYIESLGFRKIHPDLKDLVTRHDDISRATTTAPLA